MPQHYKTVSHTPGPWHVGNNEDGLSVFSDCFNGEDHNYIACIVGVDCDKHALADTRLIAAAPKLLKALQGMLDMAWCEGDKGYSDAVDEGFKAVEDALPNPV